MLNDFQLMAPSSSNLELVKTVDFEVQLFELKNRTRKPFCCRHVAPSTKTAGRKSLKANKKQRSAVQACGWKIVQNNLL